jgi:hypothetical protein
MVDAPLQVKFKCNLAQLSGNLRVFSKTLADPRFNAYIKTTLNCSCGIGSEALSNYSDHDAQSRENPKVAINTGHGGDDAPLNLSLKLDMLDYLADMLLEMKGLAERTQCETLIGMIALAAREAELRRRN